MRELVDERTACGGFVHFPGTRPRRLSDLTALARAGVRVEELPPGGGDEWIAALTHPVWGDARVACPTGGIGPIDPAVFVDHRLTGREVAEFMGSPSILSLSSGGAGDDPLDERKDFLRFARAVMGEEGIGVYDSRAGSFWSRQHAEDELAVDASLDVSALYVLHAVADDRGQRPGWLHSHGLGEIGYFDFDIVRPHEDILEEADDLCRCLAWAILDGAVRPDTARHVFAEPGGEIAFVPVPEFVAGARRRDGALRADPERSHWTNRSVICEPGRRRRTKKGRCRPSRWFSSRMPDAFTTAFSARANRVMAERAVGTWDRLLGLGAEMPEGVLPVRVKAVAAVETPDGEVTRCMWFEARRLREDSVDVGPLTRLMKGQRLRDDPCRTIDVDQLVDWAADTPIGTLTPRTLSLVRMVREGAERLNAAGWPRP
jgi:hypothetical protein